MTRVFDASAVLAAIFQEPGSEQVAQLWQDGDNLISAVNYSEVVAKLSTVCRCRGHDGDGGRAIDTGQL